jgi:hypothetical protein
VKADEMKIAVREGGHAVAGLAFALDHEHLHAALLGRGERVVLTAVPAIPRGLVGAQASLVRGDGEGDTPRVDLVQGSRALSVAERGLE